MSRQVQSIRRRLQSALIFANEAAVTEATFRVRRSAMRSLHRALRDAAECDELWVELVAMNETSNAIDPGFTEMHRLLDSLSDAFGETYVVLLVAGGYRHPPPPSAIELLASLHEGFEASFDHAPSHMNDLRAKLLEFIEAFEEGLAIRRSESQIGSLISGKRVGAALMAALAAVSITIKTGEEFAVDIGLDLGEGPSIEIVVPRPWTATAANYAISGAAYWHVDHQIEIALGSTATAAEGEMPDPTTMMLIGNPKEELPPAATPVPGAPMRARPPNDSGNRAPDLDDRASYDPSTASRGEYRDGVIAEARRTEHLPKLEHEPSALESVIDPQVYDLDESEAALLDQLNGKSDPTDYLLSLIATHRILFFATRLHQTGGRLWSSSDGSEGKEFAEGYDDIRREWNALGEAIMEDESPARVAHAASKSNRFVRTLRKHLLEKSPEERRRLGEQLFNLKTEV